MSGDFNIAADASVNMTAGSAAAVGSGAYTLVVLFRPTIGNNNSGILWCDAAGAHQRSFFEDALALFGFNDFSSGFGTLTQGNWYVVAQSKAAGSNLYRMHIWAYASDGSGTMTHGTESGGASQGDGSAIDAIRIGIAEDRGNSLIAAVGLWTSALSDGQLDTLKSASLASWSALSPAELISLENWNGSTGCTAVVGTSTQSSITGTVGVGANPPSFNFALTAASAGAVARASLPPHLLRLLAARQQAQWQNTASSLQVDAQIGQAAAVAVSAATAVKVAVVTGRCATAAFSRGTAAKTAPQTANSAGAAATTGAAKKVAPQTGPACAATRTSGAAAKVAPRTGVTAAVGQTAGAAAKVAATTGRTAAVATSAASLGARQLTAAGYAATASAATAVKVATVTGRCAAATVTAATARKTAAVTSTTPGAATTRGTVVKRATPVAVSTAAGATRATAVKRATPTTTTLAAISCTGSAAKRAQPTGRTYAVAYSGQVDTTRQVTGIVCAVAISWSRRRITKRPNTGTTPRPNTGTTARPYTGITYRP